MRSPVAEVSCRQALQQAGSANAHTIRSAGTWTRSGLRISEGICRLVRPLGIDLRDFRTTSIDDVNLERFDWIAVMEKSHREALHYEHPTLKERIVLLTELAGEFPTEIPDPVSLDAHSALQILMEVRQLAQRAAVRLAEGNQSS